MSMSHNHLDSTIFKLCCLELILSEGYVLVVLLVTHDTKWTRVYARVAHQYQHCCNGLKIAAEPKPYVYVFALQDQAVTLYFLNCAGACDM